MRTIQCSEIWGGIENTEADLCSAGMTVSLYSSACDGGKGGDVYYFSLCNTDKISRLALADVVGHGEQVSQVSQWVFGQLETHMNDLDQPKMLHDLNATVIAKGFEAITTAAIVSYYLPRRIVYFSYAGHPPLLSHAGDGLWNEVRLPEKATARNLPLGVVPEGHYDMGETPCSTGDRLFLFSDGVLEAPNADGELFGLARLQSALAQAGDAGPMNLKAHILATLRDWTGGPLAHDDVTLIAIQLA